jgi:hypothetical protein
LLIQQHTLLFLCQTLGKEESERTAVSTVVFSIVSSLPVYILRQKFLSCDRRLKKQSSSTILVLPKIDHTVAEKVVSSITQLQGCEKLVQLISVDSKRHGSTHTRQLRVTFRGILPKRDLITII